jgi:hypothetical protein
VGGATKLRKGGAAGSGTRCRPAAAAGGSAAGARGPAGQRRSRSPLADGRHGSGGRGRGHRQAGPAECGRRRRAGLPGVWRVKLGYEGVDVGEDLGGGALADERAEVAVMCLRGACRGEAPAPRGEGRSGCRADVRDGGGGARIASTPGGCLCSGSAGWQHAGRGGRRGPLPYCGPRKRKRRWGPPKRLTVLRPGAQRAGVGGR